jgi:tetratricopeptide (TPR) repeat protein
VLIAVIGTKWLSASNTAGKSRLENPEDFVRIEIKAAFENGIAVLPVLVDGATMPPADVLPLELRPLARTQAIEVHDGAAFIRDVDVLVEPIQERVQVAAEVRALLSEGDAACELGDYGQCASKYTAAHQLRPLSKHVRARIEDRLVSAGEAARQNLRYSEALMAFTSALQFSAAPDRLRHVINVVKEEARAATRRQKGLEKAWDVSLEATLLLLGSDVAAARAQWRRALSYLPSDEKLKRVLERAASYASDLRNANALKEAWDSVLDAMLLFLASQNTEAQERWVDAHSLIPDGKLLQVIDAANHWDYPSRGDLASASDRQRGTLAGNESQVMEPSNSTATVRDTDVGPVLLESPRASALHAQAVTAGFAPEISAKVDVGDIKPDVELRSSSPSVRQLGPRIKNRDVRRKVVDTAARPRTIQPVRPVRPNQKRP